METEGLNNSGRARNAEEVLGWLREDNLNASGNSDLGGFGKMSIPSLQDPSSTLLPDVPEVTTVMDTSGQNQFANPLLQDIMSMTPKGTDMMNASSETQALHAQLARSTSFEESMRIQAEIDRRRTAREAQVPTSTGGKANSNGRRANGSAFLNNPLADLTDVDIPTISAPPLSKDPPSQSKVEVMAAPSAAQTEQQQTGPVRKSSAKRLLRSRISQQKWRVRKRAELEALQVRSAKLTEVERTLAEREEELAALRKENQVLHAMVAKESSVTPAAGATGAESPSGDRGARLTGVITAPTADDPLETEYLNLIELISRSLHSRAVSDVVVPMVQRAFGLSVQLLSRAGPLPYPIQELSREQHASYWEAVGTAMNMNETQRSQVALFRQARTQAIQDTHDERFRLYTTLRSLVMCGPTAMSPPASQLYTVLGVSDQLRHNLLKEQHSRLIFCQALLQNMNPLQAAQLLVAQFPEHMTGEAGAGASTPGGAGVAGAGGVVVKQEPRGLADLQITDASPPPPAT